MNFFKSHRLIKEHVERLALSLDQKKNKKSGFSFRFVFWDRMLVYLLSSNQMELQRKSFSATSVVKVVCADGRLTFVVTTDDYDYEGGNST